MTFFRSKEKIRVISFINARDVAFKAVFFAIGWEGESSQERQVENGSKMRDECVVIMFVCSS